MGVVSYLDYVVFFCSLDDFYKTQTRGLFLLLSFDYKLLDSSLWSSNPFIV